MRTLLLEYNIASYLEEQSPQPHCHATLRPTFPVPCLHKSVSYVIVSTVSSSYHLQICGHHDFTSVLETHCNCLLMNSPGIITISTG